MKEKIKKIFVASVIYSAPAVLLIVIYAGAVYITKNISHKIAKDVLEYLRVLAWPGIVIFTVITFRKDISDLICRVKIWNSPFGKVEAVESKQQQEAIDEPNDGSIDESFAQSKEFAEILQHKTEEVASLKQTHEELARKLTIAQIWLDFERIFNIIFVNQIELIKQILQLDQETVPLNFVIDYFLRIQQQESVLRNWSLTEYMKFLRENELLEYIMKGEDIFVSVTSKGQAFMNYIETRGYKKYGL